MLAMDLVAPRLPVYLRSLALLPEPPPPGRHVLAGRGAQS